MSAASSHHPPRVGIVGAGQLARMTYQAAIPLGIELRVLAVNARDSAALVVLLADIGDHRDLQELQRWAAGNDVTTMDHELVPHEHLRALEAEGHVLRPSAAALKFSQDKRHQRRELGRLGLPVPAWEPVSSPADLERFGSRHAWPVVAKAAWGGYDGKGVWVLHTAADTAALPWDTTELMVEEHCHPDLELAVLVARRPGGDAVTYPVVETLQRDGICHELIVPARLPPTVAAEACRVAASVADAVGAVGILAVELFVRDGAVIVNEVACRPHNSGHFSIEGCVTSQFSNHLRAVLDWPLGDTDLRSPAVVTVNVLGTECGDPAARLPEALAVRDLAVHLYGKPWRAGRKLGHVTATGDELDETYERARRAARILAGP